MSMETIAYRSGYKYQLAEDYRLKTGVLNFEISADYIQLSTNGSMTIKAGYAWDGPSGPAIDTKNTMRGSLIHDAFYQLMRAGLIPESCRKQIDKLYRSLCLEDGMWKVRAWWHFKGVDWFAANAAHAEAKKQILVAP